MDYNLLFRCFIGLAMDAPIWDVMVFTKNQERLLAGDIGQPRVRARLLGDHFSVDGSLIKAGADVKRFRPRDDGDGGSVSIQSRQALGSKSRSSGRHFQGEKLTNATHASTTHLDPRQIKKARNQAAKLCHMSSRKTVMV